MDGICIQLPKHYIINVLYKRLFQGIPPLSVALGKGVISRCPRQLQNSGLAANIHYIYSVDSQTECQSVARNGPKCWWDGVLYCWED